MDASGDGSKVQCCREQYCIGTWNVRSMTQGKLEVVKQEMARLNIDIWRISKINWSEMGEFNSDDHYIYYCGQEFLKWSSRHSQQKNLKYSTWMQSQKWQNDLCSFQRQTIQYYNNPSLCPNEWCWRSWNWMVRWRPTRPSRTNAPKKMSFSLQETGMQN